MSWELEKSDKRIADHMASLGDIVIEPLTRTADLEALLSETNCREITAAHVYVDLPNFAQLVDEAGGDAMKLRKLARAIHVYEREVSRIVEREASVGGFRVHFQGTRLHALLYRSEPMGDEAELSRNAVILLLIMRDFVRAVFNPAFPGLTDLRVSGGADVGVVIGTKNGMTGERELLFLGSPANYAAKILSPGDLRVTSRVVSNLPESLADLLLATSAVDPAGEPVYALTDIEQSDLVALADDCNVKWDPVDSAERVDEDRDAVPLSEISVEAALTKIDFDLLSVRKMKRVEGISVFADVSGFTKRIDSATSSADQREAIRTFHAIRRELSRVMRLDFEGVHVQHQGDRLQALFHVPVDVLRDVASEAVWAAAGVQSSMLLSLPVHVNTTGLSIAIGIDLGTTLASKLGTRGDRDRICVGQSVEDAAAREERTAGGATSISGDVYELLAPEIQQFFKKDAIKGDWVAECLTIDKLERAKAAARYSKGPVHVKTSAATAVISEVASATSRAVSPARSFGE